MYIRMIRPALLAIFLLPFAAVAGMTETDYQSAYKAAMAVHEKVVALGNQWKTTNDVLDAAEKAAAKGNYDEATGLAKRAGALAQLAVEQSEHQKKVWKDWKQAVMH